MWWARKRSSGFVVLFGGINTGRPGNALPDCKVMGLERNYTSRWHHSRVEGTAVRHHSCTQRASGSHHRYDYGAIIYYMSYT
ncbi:hypothetical protein BKA80DRAFT_98017 [Phyllosticta citrichinensis]